MPDTHTIVEGSSRTALAGARVLGRANAHATMEVTLKLRLMNENRGTGKRIGFLTPILYQSPNGTGSTIGQFGCTDVVSGNNITASVGGYSAGPGYDAVSGWGTPVGTKLLQALP
jgi:hypothetical protein